MHTCTIYMQTTEWQISLICVHVHCTAINNQVNNIHSLPKRTLHPVGGCNCTRLHPPGYRPDCIRVCQYTCTHTHMYCILIDAHLTDGDLLAMHDVFPLMICSVTRVCVSTHPQMMYALHSYRCPLFRWGSTGDAWCVPIEGNWSCLRSVQVYMYVHSLIMYAFL